VLKAREVSQERQSPQDEPVAFCAGIEVLLATIVSYHGTSPVA